MRSSCVAVYNKRVYIHRFLEIFRRSINLRKDILGCRWKLVISNRRESLRGAEQRSEKNPLKRRRRNKATLHPDVTSPPFGLRERIRDSSTTCEIDTKVTIVCGLSDRATKLACPPRFGLTLLPLSLVRATRVSRKVYFA